MKKFRYSLETLLTLRREREQEKEIALAHAAGQLAEIDRRIAAAKERGERIFLAGAGTLQDLEARERVWKKSAADIAALDEPRRQAAGRVEVARKDYAAAHSERAALDRLKEKRHMQWKSDIRREEIRRLDETAKGSLVRARLTGGDV